MSYTIEEMSYPLTLFPGAEDALSYVPWEGIFRPYTLSIILIIHSASDCTR